MRATRSALRTVLLTGIALSLSAPALATPAQPWRDRALSPEARATALVKAMTQDEKFQLVRTWFPPLATGKPGAPTDMIPSAGEMVGIPRLGIPTLRESDASLGVANQVEQRKGDVATALPSSLATAASFDPEIARAGGANPRLADSILLPALAAAFLSAAAIRPGRYNVGGALVSVYFLAVLNNGLNLAGAPEYVSSFVNGGALIIGVGVAARLGGRREP